METHKSARHRSLGIGTTSPPARSKRPSIGERHQSAPLVARQRKDQANSMTSTSLLRRGSAVQASDREETTTDVQKKHPIINLVVLGNPRVGKTTFIRKALDVDDSTPIVPSSTEFAVNGISYHVNLHDIDLEELEITDEHNIEWASVKTSERGHIPSVDGVLCLYDITCEDSIDGVPQALYALTKAKTPIVLVACKSDAPMSKQEIGITFIERVRRSFPLVIFAEHSFIATDSAKKCVAVIMKAVSVIVKLEHSTQRSNGDDEQRSNKTRLSRIRTTDFETPTMIPADPHTPVSDTDNDPEPTHNHVYQSKNPVPQTPESFRQGTGPDQEPQSADERGPDRQRLRGTESDLSNSSDDRLEMKLSNAEADGYSDKSHTENGVSFSDLVDRLLRMPTTKNEGKFLPAFLCLYRMFATPRRLLTAILDRFVSTQQSNLVSLTKMGELLRYLQVLAQWTALYPGDFADQSARKAALSFAQDLEQNKNFAPSAKEIIGNLLTIVMDDDQDWACRDESESDEYMLQRARAFSFSMSKMDNQKTAESDLSEEDGKDIRRRSVRDSGTASIASSLVRSSVASSQSATNLFNLESAREQSRFLKTVPHIPLTKIQWHHFMSIPNEELAREITRIDWTMYSAIRARDFVRHVNLTSHQRAHFKHYDTIGMMVKQFNHLALFVSGMILLRDKPKHRVKILEKFMDLAWKVRQMNNYNSLGAIVAGITGPEIARLTHTYELVPNETKKQFLRLTVLMSISRSHASYRMAWENSFSERIPFIPLVRQDLTMATSKNSTFIGDKVNWKKFEIMGDVIIGIQRSHDQPYNLPDRSSRSRDIAKLIMETKVIEESEESADPRSELYDRSVQLEPGTGSEARKSMVSMGVKRTMSGWFQS